MSRKSVCSLPVELKGGKHVPASFDVYSVQSPLNSSFPPHAWPHDSSLETLAAVLENSRIGDTLSLINSHDKSGPSYQHNDMAEAIHLMWRHCVDTKVILDVLTHWNTPHYLQIWNNLCTKGQLTEQVVNELNKLIKDESRDGLSTIQRLTSPKFQENSGKTNHAKDHDIDTTVLHISDVKKQSGALSPVVPTKVSSARHVPSHILTANNKKFHDWMLLEIAHQQRLVQAFQELEHRFHGIQYEAAPYLFEPDVYHDRVAKSCNAQINSLDHATLQLIRQACAHRDQLKNTYRLMHKNYYGYKNSWKNVQKYINQWLKNKDDGLYKSHRIKYQSGQLDQGWLSAQNVRQENEMSLLVNGVCDIVELDLLTKKMIILHEKWQESAKWMQLLDKHHEWNHSKIVCNLSNMFDLTHNLESWGKNYSMTALWQQQCALQKHFKALDDWLKKVRSVVSPESMYTLDIRLGRTLNIWHRLLAGFLWEVGLRDRSMIKANCMVQGSLKEILEAEQLSSTMPSDQWWRCMRLIDQALLKMRNQCKSILDSVKPISIYHKNYVSEVCKQLSIIEDKHHAEATQVYQEQHTRRLHAVYALIKDHNQKDLWYSGQIRQLTQIFQYTQMIHQRYVNHVNDYYTQEHVDFWIKSYLQAIHQDYDALSLFQKEVFEKNDYNYHRYISKKIEHNRKQSLFYLKDIEESEKEVCRLQSALEAWRFGSGSGVTLDQWCRDVDHVLFTVSKASDWIEQQSGAFGKSIRSLQEKKIHDQLLGLVLATPSYALSLLPIVDQVIVKNRTKCVDSKISKPVNKIFPFFSNQKTRNLDKCLILPISLYQKESFSSSQKRLYARKQSSPCEDLQSVYHQMGQNMPKKQPPMYCQGQRVSPTSWSREDRALLHKRCSIQTSMSPDTWRRDVSSSGSQSSLVTTQRIQGEGQKVSGRPMTRVRTEPSPFGRTLQQPFGVRSSSILNAGPVLMQHGQGERRGSSDRSAGNYLSVTKMIPVKRQVVMQITRPTAFRPSALYDLSPVLQSKLIEHGKDEKNFIHAFTMVNQQSQPNRRANMFHVHVRANNILHKMANKK